MMAQKRLRAFLRIGAMCYEQLVWHRQKRLISKIRPVLQKTLVMVTLRPRYRQPLSEYLRNHKKKRMNEAREAPQGQVLLRFCFPLLFRWFLQIHPYAFRFSLSYTMNCPRFSWTGVLVIQHMGMSRNSLNVVSRDISEGSTDDASSPKCSKSCFLLMAVAFAIDI